MQLSQIYSSDESVFPTIEFFFGSLNVVFARVNDPKLKDRDSHNLGKTFLTRVIDFCLLAKITKVHPFRVRDDLFGDFVFYLELLTNSGEYVTVRRAVNGKIAITTDKVRRKKLDLESDEWDYHGLGLRKAKNTLNSYLDLDALQDFHYRKGLSYQLRTQSDYLDEFKTSSFGRGKHIEWKPYIAMLFGFDHDLLRRKYGIDESIKTQESAKNEYEQQVGTRAQYDEIRGIIEYKEIELEEMSRKVDQFSFREIESSINETVVNELDTRIAELNTLRYKLNAEIVEIEKSLETRYIIDVDDMMRVFEETEIAMPESLVKSYQDLERFNREMSIERVSQLRQLLSEKKGHISRIDSDIVRLDQQRVDALSILAERETLKKYRALQQQVAGREREISDLRQKLASLDHITTFNQRINQLKIERTKIAGEIEYSINKNDSEIYRDIRRKFVSFVQEIINVPAQIHIEPNEHGNLNFVAKIMEDDGDTETSQSSGNSYKKVLAVCYDLAVMCAYADQSYYQFVYHDGVFEGLDNRKKVGFLNLIRRLTKEYKIQYILTVIDSDLPRDNRDNKLMFTFGEVVKQLHDGGNDGRLFRMEKF